MIEIGDIFEHKHYRFLVTGFKHKTPHQMSHTSMVLALRCTKTEAVEIEMSIGPLYGSEYRFITNIMKAA